MDGFFLAPSSIRAEKSGQRQAGGLLEKAQTGAKAGTQTFLMLSGETHGGKDKGESERSKAFDWRSAFPNLDALGTNSKPGRLLPTGQV